MNINNKTTKLFSICDITEMQIQSLLTLACKPQTIDGLKGTYLAVEPDELEMLNSLRQALLSAGMTKRGN